MSETIPKVRVPLIFGTMTFGEGTQSPIRSNTLPACQAILDVFFKYGHTELDTARMYGGGTTEEYLGKLDLKNAVVDSKIWPNPPDGHKPAAIRKSLLTSLKALNAKKVRVFYLHAPDRGTPFEETCEEMNKLHQEGLFEIFGLSNFAAWQVAEIVAICRKNGWIQPKIYQAVYHALLRNIEPELVPCLHEYGIRLVIYNPLAGGFLAGRMLTPDTPLEGRYLGESGSAAAYRGRYFNDAYFGAINEIKAVADKHGLKMSEVAFRWCQHHSALLPTDGIILGASSPKQLEENCIDSAKGPLPQDVVDALDTGWVKVAGFAPAYIK